MLQNKNTAQNEFNRVLYFQCNKHYFIMSDPIVEVHQGKLRGVNEKNINGINFMAFRGIPYGKSPVGKLRFKVI